MSCSGALEAWRHWSRAQWARWIRRPCGGPLLTRKWKRKGVGRNERKERKGGEGEEVV